MGACVFNGIPMYLRDCIHVLHSLGLLTQVHYETVIGTLVLIAMITLLFNSGKLRIVICSYKNNCVYLLQTSKIKTAKLICRHNQK